MIHNSIHCSYTNTGAMVAFSLTLIMHGPEYITQLKFPAHHQNSKVGEMVTLTEDVPRFLVSVNNSTPISHPVTNTYSSAHSRIVQSHKPNHSLYVR